MRSLPFLLLSVVLVSACSQNPHLEVADAPVAATQQLNVDPEADAKLTNVVGSLEDQDGDGVLASDKCPTVKGPEENNGCPYDAVFDTDQDGVLNTDDRCPAEKGPAENDGCPYSPVGDADRDGTLDHEDSCPDEAGPKANRGCPYGDRDADGVYDHEDACPLEKGPTENRGCPYSTVGDYDRDGTLDREDACPKVPGPKANRGCPYPKEEEKRVLVAVMGSLKFDFDKAVIKDESFPALNKLVAFLKKYPNARLKLVGHTDNVGPDDYNQNLSEERVEAVKDYLMEADVAHNRITTDARGESEPLVKIDGLEGTALERAQAKNRRVDMSVRYQVAK